MENFIHRRTVWPFSVKWDSICFVVFTFPIKLNLINYSSKIEIELCSAVLNMEVEKRKKNDFFVFLFRQLTWTNKMKLILRLEFVKCRIVIWHKIDQFEWFYWRFHWSCEFFVSQRPRRSCENSDFVQQRNETFVEHYNMPHRMASKLKIETNFSHEELSFIRSDSVWVSSSECCVVYVLPTHRFRLTYK